jgi:hypothetical protein
VTDLAIRYEIVRPDQIARIDVGLGCRLALWREIAEIWTTIST